ncbi:hypothetical protein Tco_1008039 [Tanacetum coccineum]
MPPGSNRKDPRAQMVEVWCVKVLVMLRVRSQGEMKGMELVKRVNSLKDQLKTEKYKYTRGKFQIVISEDEADLPIENSSKQGRIIEDIDLDVDTSLVQLHATEYFTLLLLLRLVLQGSEAVNTASDLFSAAKASVNNAGDSIPVKDKDTS